MIPKVYGDLSEGDGILTAGAYLGRDDQWREAIEKWSDTLDDAGVKEFHATDFFNAQKAFDDDKWRRRHPEKGMIPGGELHNTFAERFVSIPGDAGLIGFAHSIDIAAFSEILTPILRNARRKHRDGHPRTRTIMSCLSWIGKFLNDTVRYRVNGTVPVIFEEEHGAGKFADFFKECRERNERWCYSFASFDTGPKSLVPLQMADLLAHESWRRTKQFCTNPSAPLRKSFERMVGDGRIMLNHQGRRDCEQFAIVTRDILSRYLDGLIPPEDVKGLPN